MHFRYRRKHVAKAVWRELEAVTEATFPKPYTDEPVLSVFYDRSQKGSQRSTPAASAEPPAEPLSAGTGLKKPKNPKDPAIRMYAVRYGKVHRIYCDASVAHVFYEVGKYVPLAFVPPSPDTSDQQIDAARLETAKFVDSVSDELWEMLGWSEEELHVQTKSRKDFEKLSQRGIYHLERNAPFPPSPKQQDSWEKLVWTMGSAKFFSQTIFFRIGGLNRSAWEGRRHFLFGHPRPTTWDKNEPYVAVPVVALRPWIRGWRLEVAVSHRVELYTSQLPNKESEEERKRIEDEAEITVTLDRKIFIGDDAQTRMSIKYDSHPFDFQPIFGEADSLTKITVTAFTGSGSKSPVAADLGANGGEAQTAKEDVYVPRSPRIAIWVETVHNVTYLERAAWPALMGAILIIVGSSTNCTAAVADWVGCFETTVYNRLIHDVPPYYARVPIEIKCSPGWIEFFAKATGALLLIRSFIIAVRKLPTLKI